MQKTLINDLIIHNPSFLFLFQLTCIYCYSIQKLIQPFFNSNQFSNLQKRLKIKRELNNEFGDDAGEEEGNFGDDMEDDENEEEYLARKLRFV